MTFTADLSDIAILIIALAFLIFVLAAVPALLQLKRTFQALEELTAEGRRTIESVNVIVQKAGDQLSDVEELVTKVKDVGLKVTGLAEMVVDNVRSPLIGIISFFFGAEEGFKRFFKRGKKGGGDDGDQ
ncbi:MAG: hypothetical protein A2X99_01660 [Deltaproteobacteria bacterium GWB2_55_19]|nr:MAG: hypothetical protein A2X99_01660 [Deltaproteobacteria bacterium GWB2_55_19]HAO93974.1 hypothetical protein [Deltaproteobacteria bacterium]